jgi:hypothetical protein
MVSRCFVQLIGERGENLPGDWIVDDFDGRSQSRCALSVLLSLAHE